MPGGGCKKTCVSRRGAGEMTERGRLSRRRMSPSARNRFSAWAPDEKLRFFLFLAFLAFCAFAGGSARADAQMLLALRPVTVLVLMAMLLLPGHVDLKAVRAPLLLLGAFALTMLVQLVPLPPAWWAALPGHARYADGLAGMGIPSIWRPLSLSPDRTLNSVLALLPSVVALLAVAGMGARGRGHVVEMILGLALVSAVIGALQISGGADSPLYFYRYTHAGLPVGLFANRNHEAVLLALSLPFIRIWVMRWSVRVERPWIPLLVGALISMLLIIMLLVTGSRAGFALMWLGLAGAFLVAPVRPGRGVGPGRARGLTLIGLGGAVLAGLLVASVALFNRALSVERLFGVNVMDDGRALHWPSIVDLAAHMMPTGSGFGSFDSVYRGSEPDALLSFTYFNNAHNDLLELALTGGVPALAVLVVFLLWFGASMVRNMRMREQEGEARAITRACVVAIAIILCASIFDYPLRTPLMSAVFAVLCAILAHNNFPHVRTNSRVALASGGL